MRIAIAQIDPIVGDFKTNVKKIKEAYERACSERARLLLTPELSVCGYPLHDLVERPELFDRTDAALEELAKLTQGKDCVLAVGHVARNPLPQGRAALNGVSLLQDGKKVFFQAKTLLPTYDVFDESRYFEPASQIQVWECDGKKIAFAICEDLWSQDPALSRRIYARDPLDEYARLKADLVISISASPYSWEKRARREGIHSQVAQKLSCPLIYCNQTGATDEILFDGGSFAVGSKGEFLGRLPVFKTSFGSLDWDLGSGVLKWHTPSVEEREDQAPQEIEVLYRALVTGIREYFHRTGFQLAILGLSGGIDSSVVAVLAVHALGDKKVLGVGMPSQYSSIHSLEDAEALARNLGIAFEVRPIKFLYSTAQREMSEGRGQLAPIALENLQARLRGLTVMTLSNHHRALVLTTSNKSELATGYGTLYGDMAGALAPIGDVYKTRVYELAHWINQKFGELIPERCLTKAPSAELRPNQTDQDTLPPYDALDALLEEYLEKGCTLNDLESRHGSRKDIADSNWVRNVLRWVELNEFKRRQGAPVLKVSSKAFGIGRRIPLAKIWTQF